MSVSDADSARELPLRPATDWIESGTVRLECLFCPRPLVPKRNTVLVLPSNIGMAKYTVTLVGKLHEALGWNIVAINFSGQGRSSGECSLQQATRDLDVVMGYLHHQMGDSSTSRVMVLAHCVGLLPVLELARSPAFPDIGGVVVYHYLHTPARLIARAIPAMRSCGIRLGEQVGPAGYDTSAGLNRLPCKIVVLHPPGLISKLRATEAELILVSNSPAGHLVIRPSNGYDLVDLPQEDAVAIAVKRDLTPALRYCVAA